MEKTLEQAAEEYAEAHWLEHYGTPNRDISIWSFMAGAKWQKENNNGQDTNLP